MAVVLGQFLNSLPSLTRIWVRETEAKSFRQAGEIADQCDHAKGSGLKIQLFETKERQDPTRPETATEKSTCRCNSYIEPASSAERVDVWHCESVCCKEEKTVE